MVALEAQERRVVVGPRAALARRRVQLHDVNWLAATPPSEGLAVTVKLRSAQPAVAATLFLDEDRAEVLLAEPEYGVAPGQACVAYQGERLLGGGWITGSTAE